jgi:hypothetical protein
MRTGSDVTEFEDRRGHEAGSANSQEADSPWEPLGRNIACDTLISTSWD